MKLFKTFTILLALFATLPLLAQADDETELVGLDTIVDAIEQLEGRSDAKCHASATRLENFMYGTPLTFEAREAKVRLQKAFILDLWEQASDKARANGAPRVDAAVIQPFLDEALPAVTRDNGDVIVTLPERNETLLLTERDVRQYSSIAYALRAILSVQQEALLSPELDLLPLTQDAIDSVKRTVDLHTLAALNLSDRTARRSNETEVTATNFAGNWNEISTVAQGQDEITLAAGNAKPGEVVRRIVDQKLASYAKYNSNARDFLFYSNIRAFYARHPWPDDMEQIREITQAFSTVSMNITAEWILRAQAKAIDEGDPLIRESHIAEVFHETAPFEVNQYEDITFFYNLPHQKRLKIEAYDADSFRDSGLHFQLVKQVIDSPNFPLTADFDPFAAEYLAEGVAQMGVLIFRVAGMIAKEKGDPVLTADHVVEAQDRIAALMKQQLDTPAPKVAKTPIASAAATAVPVSGEFFDDISSSTGIDYVHRSSDWLSRFIRSFLYSVHAPDAPNPTRGEAAHDAPPAFSGSGIAADDIDGDGDDDVLVVGGLGNRLYLNNGDGTFVDTTRRAGINFLGEDGKPGEARQPIIADLDNDGDQDILITYVDADHRLYRNDGDGTFTDVSKRAGLGGKGLVGSAATVFDFDRDGLLDVYLAYYGNYVEGVGPNLARVNTNATPNKLLRNTGGMKFEDVSAGSGTENRGWSQAVAAVDFDADGWQDLIVGNDFGVNSYYRNNGDGTFTDVAGMLGTDIPSSAMNVGTADLNRDGFPEVYISNILTLVKDEKYVLPTEDTKMKFRKEKLATMRIVASNHLFKSAAEDGELASYVLSDEIDRADTGWAWDADFFDFDNDGDDDLYCVNGLNEYKFYDATFPIQTPEGEQQIIFSVNEKEPNVFFVNEDGRLKDRSDVSGAGFSGNSRAAAYLDHDLDGDLDIVVNNFHEPVRFFRNNAESLDRNWIKVKLVGDVKQHTNRDAIGAVLQLRPDSAPAIWRTVQGGTGYLSHHPKEQHFGIGFAERADLEIIWPNGNKDVIRGLKANERYEIHQSGKITPSPEPAPETVADAN